MKAAIKKTEISYCDYCGKPLIIEGNLKLVHNHAFSSDSIDLELCMECTNELENMLKKKKEAAMLKAFGRVV